MLLKIKWFQSYDEAYCYVAENGFNWYPYGETGIKFNNGSMSSISTGEGASKGLFMAGGQK